MQRQQPTLEDRLILAQVVHLLGASEWQFISNSLLRVSVDRGKQIAYTALECETLWTNLMRQINVNLADPAVQDRVRAPQAPESLELVKRLFHYRLTELHQHIAEKENAFRLLNNELNEIKSGAWDERIAPKKPEPAPVTPAPAVHVPATASSSSSQLSSIDSPVHTPTVAASAPQEGMDIDEADVTLTQKEDEMEAEPEKPKSPAQDSPVAEEDEEDNVKDESKDGNSDAEGDSEESDEENEEEEKARPIRGLRSRNVPVLEPLEIPSATSPKASRKGKGHKASDSTSQPSKGRRRNDPESAKPPQSPASVAGTFESVATPAAATDENVSVADDGGRRRSTRGHKRKASEMDVDLPAPSLKRLRDRSSTLEDEPMTPAVPSSATGRSSNKLKQAMTQIIILLNNNKHAELFRRPVTKKDAPDYAQAVQRPMDLATIQRAIKSGQILSWDELERELRRMLANCCVYNRPGTSAYETAKLMLSDVEQMLEVAREGAGDGK